MQTPPLTVEQANAAADVFVPDAEVSQLPADEAARARNLTLDILSVPQPDRNVTFALSRNSTAIINFTLTTNGGGEVDAFVPINSSSLPSGADDGPIVRLDSRTNDTALGNSSVFLVPRRGITLVSDIDDILRVTRIYQPEDALNNSFVRPYVPWLNMPAVLAKWQQRIPNLHFH